MDAIGAQQAAPASSSPLLVGAARAEGSDDLGAERAESEAAGSGVRSPFATETLARTLRAVATELERDPALAQRVAAIVAAESPAAEHLDSTSVGASTGSPYAQNSTTTPEQTESPPTVAPRLNRTFRPRLITGSSPDLGAGIPDPFALHKKLGLDGLRAALDELRLGTLRAIVREHGLDPKGTLSRQNDAGKLRTAILAAATKPRK